jgi:hypothetical protein
MDDRDSFPVSGSPQSNQSPNQIILLGDVTTNFDRDLQQLLQCKSNALLQSFFSQVHSAYLCELASLDVARQSWFLRSTNIVDLVANFGSCTGQSAVGSALLCATQIGRFIS